MKVLWFFTLPVLMALPLNAQNTETNANETFRFLIGAGIQRNTFSISAQGISTDKKEPAIRLHVRIGAEWYLHKNLFLYSGLEWMDRAGKRDVRTYSTVPVSSSSPIDYVLEFHRSSFHYAQLALGLGYLISAKNVNIRPAAGMVPAVLCVVGSQTRFSSTFNPEPQINRSRNEFPQNWNRWWNGEFRISVEPRNAYRHWGIAVFYQQLLKNPELGLTTVQQSNVGLQFYRWF